MNKQKPNVLPTKPRPFILGGKKRTNQERINARLNELSLPKATEQNRKRVTSDYYIARTMLCIVTAILLILISLLFTGYCHGFPDDDKSPISSGLLGGDYERITLDDVSPAWIAHVRAMGKNPARILTNISRLPEQTTNL